MKTRRGFISLIVIACLAGIVLVATSLVAISSNELVQTKTENDHIRAYYLAAGGAERMFAKMKNLSNISANNPSFTTTFPYAVSTTSVSVGSCAGNYSVSAVDSAAETDVMVVRSTATVGSRSEVVTVKYGYTETYRNGVPIGAKGDIASVGHGPSWWPARVSMAGPVESMGSITPANNTNTVYVTYSGDITPNKTDSASPSFWIYQQYDTTNTGFAFEDGGTGEITLADATTQAAGDQAILDTFTANDINGDNVIDDKDAFRYYYTQHLTQPANNRTGASLGLDPGGANYYAPAGGTKDFGPWTVPNGTNIVYVEGNATILLSATNWAGGASDLTLVASGDITVVEPINGSDDRMTLIAGNNIITGGEGIFGAVNGDLVMYAGGNYTAILGGRANTSMWIDGALSNDTYLIFGLFARTYTQGTTNYDWGDSSKRPLGLPPGFRECVKKFELKSPGGSGGYRPRWQIR